MKEVLLFTPTPNEYEAVRRRVGQSAYKNFRATVIESGPGKINAAFKVAAEVLPRLAAGRRPALIAGVGTSGSLSLDLAAGQVIASASAVIADWQMAEGPDRSYSPYGQFAYRPLSPPLAEEMALTCADPAVAGLLARLAGAGFKIGRMMTSDTFVAGRDYKLSQGRAFNCLACDMESGAFAWAAQAVPGGVPWFHLRVVADTLDESLDDYFNKEVNMVEILGDKAAEALAILDDLL